MCCKNRHRGAVRQGCGYKAGYRRTACSNPPMAIGITELDRSLQGLSIDQAPNYKDEKVEREIPAPPAQIPTTAPPPYSKVSPSAGEEAAATSQHDKNFAAAATERTTSPALIVRGQRDDAAWNLDSLPPSARSNPQIRTIIASLLDALVEYRDHRGRKKPCKRLRKALMSNLYYEEVQSRKREHTLRCGDKGAIWRDIKLGVGEDLKAWIRTAKLQRKAW